MSDTPNDQPAAIDPNIDMTEDIMLVNRRDVFRLISALGGVPAGRGYSGRMPSGVVEPSLKTAVDNLERDLESNRAMAKSYEKDRTALHQIHSDFAAAGRLFKFMGLEPGPK